MGETPITLLLVDDHEMVVEALKSSLDQQSGLQVIDTCNNSDDAVRMASELRPNVVLLDICIPGRGAFEAARDILALGIGTRVLLVSGFLADVFIAQALKLRLGGYVLKGESISFLADAVRRVSAGETVFSKDVENRVVFDPQQQKFVARYESDLSMLTGRQLEVLRHLACGQSVKEIAKVMHLSQKSVDSHKYRIMKVIGASDRVDLTRWAIREGLIEA